MTAPTKEQRQRLFRCAGEGDFRVAGPAMMILDKLPVTDKMVPEWLPLLQSQGVATRRLALSKVGDRDTAEVAEALSGQLAHGDRAYREEVLSYLSRTERGRKALAKRLAEAETADAADPHCTGQDCLHLGARQAGAYLDPLPLLGARGPSVLLPWSGPGGQGLGGGASTTQRAGPGLPAAGGVAPRPGGPPVALQD